MELFRTAKRFAIGFIIGGFIGFSAIFYITEIVVPAAVIRHTLESRYGD